MAIKINQNIKNVLIIGSGSIANQHIQNLINLKINVFVIIKKQNEKKRFDRGIIKKIKFISSISELKKQNSVPSKNNLFIKNFLKKIGLFNITKRMFSIIIGLKSYSGAGGSCNYHFIFKKDLSIPDNNFISSTLHYEIKWGK